MDAACCVNVHEGEKRDSSQLSKEFGVVDDLYRGVDVQQVVIAQCLPEIHNHLFCFVHIQTQVVGFAPVR